MPEGRPAGGALRRAGAVLASPPWRRAPLQGLGSPSLLLGVAVAAAVLAFAGASRPLVGASAGRASLLADLEQGCPHEIGFRAERAAGTGARPDGPAPLPETTRAVDDLVGSTDGMGSTVVTVLAGSAALVGGGTPGAIPPTVQLVQRTDALAHVEVREAADPGPAAGAAVAWVPDSVAGPQGLGPGDQVALALDVPGAEVVTLPVAGTYRDLRQGRDRHWCTMRYRFEARSSGGSAPPPAVLVEGDLLPVLAGAGVPAVEAWWEVAPDPATWDLPAAEAAGPRLRGVADAAGNPSSEVHARLGRGPTTFDRPGSVAKASSTAATVDSVSGPVVLGTMGVALIALLAAARSWLALRAQEVTVLTLRGAGPAALAVKAAAELLPALLVGAAAGLAGALALVRTVGPDPRIEPGARTEGLLVVGAALLAALAALAVVVVAGVRRVGIGAGGAAPRRTPLPWEPVVLALAAASLSEVLSRPPLVDDEHVDGLLLLFPLLLLAGGGGLVARVVLSPRLLGAWAGRAPTPAWLAARRLVAGRGGAALVVTGTAISIGIVAFAGAMAASVQATAEVKATLSAGALQVVRLSGQEVPPPEPPLPASTVVTRTTESGVVRAGHDRADVLGVDPATLAGAAVWDASFAGPSLDDLLGRLGDGEGPARDGGAVAALAVGDGLPDRFPLSLDGDDGPVTLEVAVVGRAEAFPGLGWTARRPLVVVDRRALAGVGVHEHAEVWVDDPSPAVPDALRDRGLSVVYATRPASTLSGSAIERQRWATDHVEVVGAAAGLVTVAGAGLHLATGAAGRRLGSAVSHRLGMSRPRLAAATAAEVGVVLGSGAAAGVGLAWLAILLVHPQLDPRPRAAPDPLLRLDLGVVAVAAAATLAVVALVTAVVEVRAARTPLPEVLLATR